MPVNLKFEATEIKITANNNIESFFPHVVTADDKRW